MPPSEQMPPDLSKFPSMQLEEIRAQLTQEADIIANSIPPLNEALARFASSSAAARRLKERIAPGQPMLIPVSDSAYCEGTVETNEAILVNIGTGYVVECSPDAAVAILGRRAAHVRAETEKLQAILAAKRDQHAHVASELARRQRAAAAQ